MKRDLISHIPLSLLGSISCLCLFVMTFSVPTGFHLWAFTGLMAMISPALAAISPRRRAVALGVAAAVYLATFFVHFSAAKEGFAILIRAVTCRYETVYQGMSARVVWTESADYALLLPFGGVALAVGLWTGGKNRRWLPPVVLTVLIFSLCVAVNSFNTGAERLAAVALTSFWLLMALTGHVRRFRRSGPATALVLLPLILLLTAGSFLAVKPDSWTRSPSQDKVVSAFERDWNRLLRSLGFNLPQETSDDPGGAVSQPGGIGDAPPPAWSDQNREGFDLHTVGPRIDRGETVFRLKASESGPLYLRGYSLGAYDPDAGWTGPQAYKTGSTDFLSSTFYLDPIFQSLTALQNSGYKADATVEIRRISADTSTSLLPYFHTKQIQQMWDDKNGSSYLLEGNDVRTFDMLTHYRAEYVPYAGDYSELLENGQTDLFSPYTAFVKSQYLTLPEGYRDRLLPIMAEGNIPADTGIIKNGDRLAVARKVADYLANVAVYDKNVSFIRAGEDFTLRFLTETRRGYCVHFATAATLLCRAAGVPARYVSGFLAEVPDADEWINVTDERAHAWVEIYLDGFGWVPVEATPTGRESPVATTEPAPTTATEPTPSNETTTAPLGQTVPSATAPAGGQTGTTRRDPTWLVWVAAGALLLAVIPLQREWRLARHRRRFREKDLNRSALYAWHFARRTVKYGGKVPERLQDLAEKARFSRDGVSPEERQEAVDLTLALRDEVYASLPHRKKLAIRLWSALK